jgi:phosphomevalonate kinase
VGAKLGMGGSARAALLAVELTRFSLEGSFDPLKVALLAHVKAQGGAGSGGDVAAIFAGGIVRYRRYPIEELATASARGQLPSALSGAPPVDLRRLPNPRVRLSYAYSGQSSSTPSLIGQVEQRLTLVDRERVRDESDQLVHGVEESILRGDFASLIRAVSGLQNLLSSLGPLETEAIRRILAIAASYGGAGKISGAGAGDGCILFSPDEDSEREMLAGLRTRGFWVTPVAAEAGIRGEAQPQASLEELAES